MYYKIYTLFVIIILNYIDTYKIFLISEIVIKTKVVIFAIIYNYEYYEYRYISKNMQISK